MFKRISKGSTRAGPCISVQPCLLATLWMLFALAGALHAENFAPFYRIPVRGNVWGEVRPPLLHDARFEVRGQRVNRRAGSSPASLAYGGEVQIFSSLMMWIPVTENFRLPWNLGAQGFEEYIEGVRTGGQNAGVLIRDGSINLGLFGYDSEGRDLQPRRRLEFANLQYHLCTVTVRTSNQAHSDHGSYFAIRPVRVHWVWTPEENSQRDPYARTRPVGESYSTDVLPSGAWGFGFEAEAMIGWGHWGAGNLTVYSGQAKVFTGWWGSYPCWSITAGISAGTQAYLGNDRLRTTIINSWATGLFLNAELHL